MLNAFVRKDATSPAPDPARTARDRTRAVFGTAYAMAAAITALAIWLVASAPGAGPIAPASRALLLVLGLNLLLILGLAGVVGARIVALARQRSADAGARLHMRFVALFGAAAVVPAVVVALFFGVLVTRGVESWFSETVRGAVENGARIGKDYLRDVSDEITDDLQAMTGELRQIRPMFPNRLSFSNALAALAEFRGYAGLYLLSADGTILARGEIQGAPAYLGPTSDDLAQAEAGGAPSRVTEGPDAVRALYPLADYPGAYLYVVRPLRTGMVERLRNAEQSIVAYRERETSRAQVQMAFGMAYVETALLVLVGAAWLGMTAAGAISRPVAKLVQAADRVAGGDLTARVETSGDPDEIAVLSHAFNRMTGDLNSQQEALRAAGAEAENRSRFIETVLSGVSAGVLGLDQRGRISAANAQAMRLLGLEEGAVIGLTLDEAAPELGALAARAGMFEAEEDVDVTRGSETRRLRVRVSGHEAGGFVLTFDDITRLMTAQRNAAWRDVARRIAHEIKNPLTPIQLSAERLRRKYRDQITSDVDTFDRCTDTIVRQVGDIGRMVDEFSSFARMPAPKFAPEDAAELLHQAVFAQRVAYPDIAVDLTGGTDRIEFVADGRMVGQALGNVLKNAGEAVAARRSGDHQPGHIHAWLDVGPDMLSFIVEDDGVGLPSKDRDRLTEPYVTTREKGTGLGLAIVKRICEDHGGELKLGDATTLNGARVTLQFPRVRKAAAEQPLPLAARGFE